MRERLNRCATCLKGTEAAHFPVGHCVLFGVECKCHSRFCSACSDDLNEPGSARGGVKQTLLTGAAPLGPCNEPLVRVGSWIWEQAFCAHLSLAWTDEYCSSGLFT
ncbi:hypothetical protein AMEX_G650 [Astyanax mexicanus]|uniref:Uncharacterized protein n=1 Tax=Astyanax mexicanus TaxID=7994 RepID=A0A8T2MKR1_ASTMX|nr:hypothetical protein AMEX_G650 [Astyanax mexicanus]